MKNILPWLVAGVALLFAGSLLLKNPSDGKQPLIPLPLDVSTSTPSVTLSSSPNQVLVTRVIDGDTVEIEGETRVRYIGIDTPEVGQCLAEAATGENSQFVAGKNVKLETDIEKYDKYGRFLAYVFVDNIFVNEKLVADGLATVTTYSPDVKYVDRYLAAQKEAKQAKLGLWNDNTCPKQVRSSNTSNPSSDCLIKGNISPSGEKIYHVPGQRYYERTRIEEQKGKHWFCTDEEAQTAGWRKSKI